MTKEYTEYAVVEAQIAELTAQQKVRKEKIIEDLMARATKSEETDLGKFTLATLKNWTYSNELNGKEEVIKENIDELKENIKAMKAKEEEDDVATCEERLSLRFSPIKL